MRLTTHNLEQHGWLFSPSLCLLIREHECGGGKWDVEMDSYRNMGTETDPRWENDGQVFDSADTLDELVKGQKFVPLTATKDWIDGDKVEFF